MKTIDVTKLEQSISKSILDVVSCGRTIKIHTEKGNAIIISEEEFNSILETLYLVSQPGLVESIKKAEIENIHSMKFYNPEEEW